MWEWLSDYWTTILLLLVALTCPLMHAIGHGRGGHSHQAGRGKP